MDIRIKLLLIIFMLSIGQLHAQNEKKSLKDCQNLLEQLQSNLSQLEAERDDLKESLELFRAGDNAAELEQIWDALNNQIVTLEQERDALQKKYEERTTLAKEFREDIVRLTNNKNLVNDAFNSEDGLMIGDYHLVDITENNSLHIAFSFAFTNALKKIKFITLTFKVYDENLNLLTCKGSYENEVSLLLEGIIKASGSTNNYKAYKRFVHEDASCLELIKMEVEYTDGSSQTYSNQIPELTSIDFKPCYTK